MKTKHSIGRRLAHLAFLEIPHLDRWGLYLPTLFVLVCWSWWKLYPVLPGYCIAALAFAAIIMTVRADKFRFIEKVVWVIISACLMLGEIRVLYLNGEEHSSELRQQQQRFAKTESDFSATGKSLAIAINNGQQQSKTTVREFTDINGREKRRFDALVNQDQKIMNHEEQLAAAQSGILTPGSEPTPVIPCNRTPLEAGAIVAIVQQGKIRDFAIFRSLPHVIVESKSHGPVLSIDPAPRGNISVVLDLRSSDGKIIARMNENGYVVNRNNTLEIHKNQHKLDVVDLYGRDVLSVRYMNPRTIFIQGMNLGLSPFIDDFCAVNASVDFLVN